MSLSKRDMDLQNYAVSDQYKGSLETTENTDCFIMDMEDASSPAVKETLTANSRISVKMQRNLSRKGSQREDKNKSILSTSRSPSTVGKTGSSLRGDDWNQEKFTLVPVKSLMMEEPFSKTITVTAENRCTSKKYLKLRSSFIGPRQVLLLFATLSSMGTIILIYFTISINKFNGGSSTAAPW